MCTGEDIYVNFIAKSEVKVTLSRPTRRQENNGCIREIYNAANTLYHLSVINVVFTNIH
jgi:hypothetical protein